VQISPLIPWLLLLASAPGVALWLVIAFRTHRMTRSGPTVRAGLHLEGTTPDHADGRGGSHGVTWPKVSIVIPTHNEERGIDACADSLRAQRYKSLEIIFVLDRCTDTTAEKLRRHAESDPRVILIENDSCPDDWAGKCNAARLGAERATGDYLLFTDADTAFDPDLVRAAVALARHRSIHLLSILSTLTIDHPHALIAQPVATMNLVRMYPIEQVNRNVRPFANGQFMLFEREHYDAIGGHAAVKDDLLEDIAFARRVRDGGGRGGIFLADGMLRCSMYDSFEAFRLGWKRIYIEACKRKPGRLRKNGLRIILNGVVLPLIHLAALATGILLTTQRQPLMGALLITVPAIALVVQHLTLMRIYRISGAPRLAAFLYPLGCWMMGRILLEAASDLAHRRPIAWGGKQYVLEPR